MPDPAPARPVLADGVRVSDADREAVAARLRDAAADGYLTMPEADERLVAAYAAVTRAELATLTTDLPAPPPAPVEIGRGGLTPRARRRLAVHAAIVAVLAMNLIVRFVLSGAPFFWPIFPITLLLGTLLLHYAFARRPTWSDIQAVNRGTTAA
ncbi:DUF1707 SHOCT-like domain-containing protein [Pseudonocardia sp. CA-107938]|uniref:DUF1707 SHOCT-like domain-containing protein n=1 Tax=Pseudonocardia sp. CA-107938 TaxID=3240021 RepID=UPI003D8F632F